MEVIQPIPTPQISSDKNNTMDSTLINPSEFHPLSNKWTLYAHLPHDTDWSIDSYKSFLEMNYLEESVALLETIPEILVKNCMLFLMKNDIKPIWEDPGNRNGGCFSYKVHIKDINVAWKNLCYSIIGNTITKFESLSSVINGATISPKKNFYIVKIWTASCAIQSVQHLADIPGLDKTGVLFRKHNPEY